MPALDGRDLAISRQLWPTSTNAGAPNCAILAHPATAMTLASWHTEVKRSRAGQRSVARDVMGRDAVGDQGAGRDGCQRVLAAVFEIRAFMGRDEPSGSGLDLARRVGDVSKAPPPRPPRWARSN